MTSSLFEKQECEYTSCYCEENVWKLCDRIIKRNDKILQGQCYVLFISSENEQVPMWYQGKQKKMVIWDYHVIFLRKTNDAVQVYDLDTRLNFPVNLDQYILASFMTTLLYGVSEYDKMVSDIRFRLLALEEFYFHFSSDRSHMLKNGKYLMPPPKWDLIQMEQNNIHNLPSFKDMTKHEFYGKILNLIELCAHFNVNYTNLLYIIEENKYQS